jgi:tetratricopeptide (TPR) repeat protein
MSYSYLLEEGKSLLEAGDPAGAIQKFTDCTELQPGQYDGWLFLGIALNEAGSPEDALDAYKKCMQINPNLPFAFANAGIAYTQLNNLPEAIRHLFKAAKMAPDDVNTRLNLGLVYYKTRNKVFEALGEFKTVIELDPTIPEAWSNIGLIFLDMDKRSYARFCFEKAKEIAPDQLDPKFKKLITDAVVDHIEPVDPFDPEEQHKAFGMLPRDLLRL